MKKYLILILPFLLIAIGILGARLPLTHAADSPVAGSSVADSPSAGSSGADSTQKSMRTEKRAVQLRAAINPPETLRVGHDLELTIEITFPETVRLDEIVWPAQWGTWDVVQSSTSDQLTANLGETTRTVKVLLRPTELGQVRIPPVPIFYTVNPANPSHTIESSDNSAWESQSGKESSEKDGSATNKTGATMGATTAESRQMVETRMFTIEVQSSVKPEDISLKSLASDNGLLSPRRHWSFWFVVVLVSIIVAGLIWSVWRAHQKRPSVETVESPQDWATRALQQLLSSNLSHTNVKQFYIELTDIIRKFIERTTLVNAPELTTEEFLRQISLGNVFSDVERMKLKSFLEQADMVKFARYEPQEDLIRQSVYSAEIFIGIEKQDI